jgi:solute carrier family 66, member 2
LGFLDRIIFGGGRALCRKLYDIPVTPCAFLVGTNRSGPYRYWNFIAYFSAGLFIIPVFLPFISHTQTYIAFLGFIGLAIEALLPVPQVLSNQRSRSSKGFRLSVLVSWLLGDTMKMSYLFYTTDPIPAAFKMCAIFQAACDCYLGVQYWMFEYRGKSGQPRRSTEEKDIRMNGL